MGAGSVVAHFGGVGVGVVAFVVTVGEVLALFCARSWLRSRRQAKEVEAERDRTDELMTM
ncbi:hypothetical protein [Actinokineospora iranica]|nr:hypothetical protein [Actinokineospora iranica]